MEAMLRTQEGPASHLPGAHVVICEEGHRYQGQVVIVTGRWKRGKAYDAVLVLVPANGKSVILADTDLRLYTPPKGVRQVPLMQPHGA